LSGASIVCRVEGREDVTESIRLSAELDEEGGQQVASVLLRRITEVKIKIRECD
jgi:hypothetical protein